MPCYTRRSVTVDLGKVDWERLERAADLLGLTVVRGYGAETEVRILGSSRPAEELTRMLKQQYTKLTIEAAAKRFGFAVKAQTSMASSQVRGAQVVQMKLGR